MTADGEILLRGDSAACVHELVDFCREGDIRFSVGHDLSAGVRELSPRFQALVPEMERDSRRRLMASRVAWTETRHLLRASEAQSPCGYPCPARPPGRSPKPRRGAIAQLEERLDRTDAENIGRVVRTSGFAAALPLRTGRGLAIDIRRFGPIYVDSGTPESECLNEPRRF
ncbi:MAG: hypothetical protein FVQ78_05865 [Solirubrobacterales bacterium]|nr:hypothetical protein [Solirubrobacterales bacterium]